jgi:hypothetical protein
MDRAVPRDDPAWRRFRGLLSVKSRQDALAVLKKCFGDLVNTQYLDHNAFAKIKVFLGTERDEGGNERRAPRSPACRWSAA